MRVQFTMTGTHAILMHADDVEAADELEAWRKAPENKNVSKAGDDRSPPWTWQTYLYSDGKNIALPQENIMVCLRAAASQIILRKQKTFKEISQSGMFIDSEYCDFFCNGKQVPIAKIKALRDKPFAEQAKAVQDFGFKLFVKRARVGTSKHVRVRPRFDSWSARGEIEIFVPEITIEVLKKMFDLAGRVGQCDWRPGCKTPGPYGMFESELKVLDAKAVA